MMANPNYDARLTKLFQGQKATAACSLLPSDCQYDSARTADRYAERLLGPMTVPHAVKWACNLYRDQWFIGAVVELRLAFYHYGFKLKVADPEVHDLRKKGLEKWWKVRKASIVPYVRDVWKDWLLIDNAISFWDHPQAVGEGPALLHVDQCIYSNAFGSKLLKYRHGLSSDQIKASSLSEEKKKLMIANAQIIIPPDQYQVLTRAKRGSGLAHPGLQRVVSPLAQLQSMEVADDVLAHICRTIWEQHKIGHEITNGQFAGFDRYFYKPKRAADIKNEYKGKTGHLPTVTNFDHSIEFPAPDHARFGAAKYDAVMQRLMWWAMPLGHILMAKQPAPWLWDMLRTLAEFERELVAEHLEAVINEAFSPPTPVVCTWSNRIFRDARLSADLMKFALMGAGLSQRTFLEEMGEDPEDEREYKAEEAALPTEKTLPLFDPNHGPAGKGKGAGPNSGAKSKAGKSTVGRPGGGGNAA